MPEFANELDAKHLPSRRQSAIKFSEADRAFIDNAGEISVAVMQGRYPLYYERDGLYQGIVRMCSTWSPSARGSRFASCMPVRTKMPSTWLNRGKWT